MENESMEGGASENIDGVEPTENTGTEDLIPKSEYEKAIATKDQLHGRATRAEAKIKEFQQLLAEKEAQAEPDKKEEPSYASTTDIARLREESILAREGYSQEEISTITEFAGDSSLLETSKNPLVKAGIEKMREEAMVVNETPSSSVNTFTAAGKTWATMSNEERKANFSNFMDSFSRKGANSNM